MSTTNSAAPVPRLGPRDREDFFEAQRRNRRATWRMSALCAASALVMGIPLTLVLTPLIYAATLLAAETYNHYSPLPPEFWQQANALARLGVAVIDNLVNRKPADAQTLAFGAVVLLLPGVLLSLALWIGVLVLFRRGGVGGALLSLNAREPNHSDLKELQLANVVEEMAIAAGLPAPKVMLVDDTGANAAAIGTGFADARVVISRRLLETLNREELEAVLANLVSSIGNGDLRIAFTLTSVFETCGLIVTLINSPFGPQSRGVLWHIVRFVFGRGAGVREQEAETVAALLTRNVGLDSDDIDNFFQPASGKPSLPRKVLTFIFFPIFFTNTAIKLILWFFTNAMLGPSAALLWRTRQYLADAGAVQLTRDPESLARALQKMNEAGSVVVGGAWASYLFVVSPERRDRMSGGAPSPEMTQAMAHAWTTTSGAPSATPAAPDITRLRDEITSVRRAAFRGDPQAIARLVAFGQAMAAARGQGQALNFPNPADILAACHGDRAAIARLRVLKQRNDVHLGTTTQSRKPPSGLQSESMLSFHPPIKRRLKRLERMGARIALPESGKGARVVAVVLSLILAPLVLLLVGLFLVLICMMVMLSLFFLTLWLVAIHGIFGLLGSGMTGR